MNPHASGEAVASSAGRAAAAAALLLVLGSSWASADFAPQDGDVPREVTLLKPPHDDLRINWSATVHEEGGEFLVSRQGLGGFSAVVARVRPRGDGRYAVAEPGFAGSRIYTLQYRDRRGRQYVLATIRLNVESLDPGRGVLGTGADGPPAAIRTAALLPMPAAQSGWPQGLTDASPGVPAPRPPSPPP